MLRFAALAAAASLAAAPAAAAVLVVQSQGTFTGVDTHNLLGFGTGEISGVSYAISFTFDLDNAHIEDEIAYGGLVVTNVASGGSNYGGPALATVQIALGAYDYTLVGDLQSIAAQGGAGFTQQAFFAADGSNVGVGAQQDGWLGLPIDVTAPPSGNLCEQVTCTGHISLMSGVYGFFSPTLYTVTYDPEGTYTPPEGPGNPGAVPEPATWALMIAGFGMAGASLRRRRAFA